MNRRRTRNPSITLAFAAATLSLAIVAPVPAAAAVFPMDTTTTMSISANPVASPETPLTFHANVTPNADPIDLVPYGTVQWREFSPYSPGYVVVRESVLGTVADVTVDALGALGPGSHTIWAVFVPADALFITSETGHIVVTVGKSWSAVTLTSNSPVEQHATIILTAATQASYADSSGTLEVYKTGIVTPVCRWTHIGAPAQYNCEILTVNTGTPSYYARYRGSATVTDSQSAPTVVSVVADTVHATNVGVSSATIYPYTDSYYDTVAIRGTRDESIKVGFKIYSPTNVLVKSGSYALGVGLYSYTWNGKNTVGTILAEGKYKVVQTLWDTYNNARTVTSYITLSKKFLHWHSGSITQLGTAAASSGHSGSGTVTAYSGYIRLTTPHIYSADWSGAGWQFNLPTAIGYRSISFKVYAKYSWLVGGGVRIGSQNFTTCPYTVGTTWFIECFDSWHDINGTGVTAWSSTGTLTSAHRYGHAVRGAISNVGGTVYIYKAQVLFSYSTLSY